MKNSIISLGLAMLLTSGFSFSNKISGDNLLLVEKGKFPIIDVINAETIKTTYLDISMATVESHWIFDSNGKILSGYENSVKMGAKGLPGMILNRYFSQLQKDYANTNLVIGTLTFYTSDNCFINLLEQGQIQKMLNASGKDKLIIDAKNCTTSIE